MAMAAKGRNAIIGRGSEKGKIREACQFFSAV